MHLSQQLFGTIDGQNVIEFVLTTTDGQSLSLLNYGATMHRWMCYDRAQKQQDILLGCVDLDGYLADHPYFGCIVGRYANRIAHGRFTLDGQNYQLTQNLRGHHLHGGTVGFHRTLFGYQIFQERDRVTVLFTGQSPDGDQGYPGTLDYMISYTYTDDNELIIEYRAMTTAPTPVNLTVHPYFNLSGGKDILDHEVRIASDAVTAVDEDIIPTGDLLQVGGSRLDLRTTQTIGKVMDTSDPLMRATKGFDHNYILVDHAEDQVVASVLHRESGRCLEVMTTAPAVQLYTGNWLDGIIGRGGTYIDHAGLCLETQWWPDSPNHPHFPNTILQPNQLYFSRTIYRVKIMQA
jgi:aldose 1-epimerase